MELRPRFFHCLFHCLALMSAGLLAAQNATSAPPGRALLPSQAFTSAEVSWQRYGEGTMEMGRQGDREVVTITSTAPRQQSGFETTLPLRGEARGLTLVAEARPRGLVAGAKGWHCGRVRIDFLDAAGARLGESCVGERLSGSAADWRQVMHQYAVPKGATQVRVALELFLVAEGGIEFSNVQVRELDAGEVNAWRPAADARIDQHRKADLQVEVIDAAGAPIPEAEVRVRMVRHAYPFGSAAPARLLTTEPKTQHQRNFQQVALNFFNYITLENDLKQKLLEKQGTAPAVEALELLKARGIQARGHVLLWPSWQQSGPALNQLKGDKAAAHQWIQEHFRTTLGATAGLAVDWDVVNEPAIHQDLMDLLGREIVPQWFAWAREYAAPGTQLYLNENNIVFSGPNQENLESWLELLRDKGAAPDGLGWQGHMWHRVLPSGADVLRDLARFERHGHKIQITEYDCGEHFSDEEEARFLGEFLPAWFSHPATAGFIMWGFQDDHHWSKNAPLFARDWSLKPAGRVWMDLVYRDWWSDADGRTDAAGQLKARLFQGQYAVQVRHGGRVETRRLELGRDSDQLRITLSAESPVWSESDALPEFNPYRGGRLPEVIPVLEAPQGQLNTLSIKVAADATVGGATEESGHLVAAGDARATLRQDIYLRFNLTVAPKGMESESAHLKLVPLEPVQSASFQVYALSNRFIVNGNELGADWAENLISSANAPARDPDAGEFRLGDASAVYLGEVAAAVEGSGAMSLSIPQLSPLLKGYQGQDITIILAPREGTRARFHARESSAAHAPELLISYRE